MTIKKVERKVITVDPAHISNGDSWKLLLEVINDAERVGVHRDSYKDCKHLKDLLTRKSETYTTYDYQQLIGHIHFKQDKGLKSGRVWTDLPFGSIELKPDVRSPRKNVSRRAVKEQK